MTTESNWRAIMRLAYDKAQSPWGGATVNRTTGELVPDGIDAYAVTVKPDGHNSIAMPADANYHAFAYWFTTARALWGHATYIGVFNDADHGTIQLDPVEVVSTTAEVDKLYQASPFSGGAYHFATGNGYWPEGSNHG